MTATELVAVALAAEGRGDLKAAIEAADAALQVAPASADAYLVLARQMRRAGYADHARLAARRGVALEPADAQAWAEQGIALRLDGDGLAAARCHRRALAREPNRADIRFALGSALLRAGSGGASRAARAFVRALALAPTGAPAYANLGHAARLSGDVAGARAALRRAVSMRPDLPAGWMDLALLERGQGRLSEAVGVLRRGVGWLPMQAALWNNLGEALRAREDRPAAVRALRRAAALAPQSAQILGNLGANLRDAGALVDALSLIERALAFAPDDPDNLYRHALLCSDLQEHEAARVLARRLLAVRPSDSRGYAVAGAAAQDLGEDTAAAAAYLRAVALDPGRGELRHLLAALSGRPLSFAPADYVRTLFDGYARKFDAHLTGTLGYRTPALLRGALDRCHGAGRRWRRAVDLGCGTGLSGEAFRDVVDHLTGIDLSPAMIEEARAKRLYDALEAAEIVGWLRAAGTVFDLCLAVDVLVYVGDLAPVMAAVAAATLPGATVAFSVESAADAAAGYALTPTGRFVHAPDYVAAVASAHGLSERAREEAVIRHQRGVPVTGLLFVLERG